MKSKQLTSEVVNDLFVPDSMIKAIIDRWCGRHCYLNGEPAKIVGRKNRFATVAQINGPLAVEFSWQTVNRIMYGKMEFTA